jgi:hypothetical protein
MLTTTVRAALESKDGRQTKILAPFPKCYPLVTDGHVKQVSDNRDALGSRGKRVIASFVASDDVPGYQTEAKNHYAKFQDKVQKHIGESLTGKLGKNRIISYWEGRLIFDASHPGNE